MNPPTWALPVVNLFDRGLRVQIGAKRRNLRGRIEVAQQLEMSMEAPSVLASLLVLVSSWSWERSRGTCLQRLLTLMSAASMMMKRAWMPLVRQ